MSEAPSPDYLAKHRIDVRDINNHKVILGSIPINRIRVYGFIVTNIQLDKNLFEDVVLLPQTDLSVLRNIPSFMEYIPVLHEYETGRY